VIDASAGDNGALCISKRLGVPNLALEVNACPKLSATPSPAYSGLHAMPCRVDLRALLFGTGCLNVFPSATAFFSSSPSSYTGILLVYFLSKFPSVAPSGNCSVSTHLPLPLHRACPLGVGLLFFCQVRLLIGHLSEQFRRPSLEMANHVARAAGMKTLQSCWESRVWPVASSARCDIHLPCAPWSNGTRIERLHHQCPAVLESRSSANRREQVASRSLTLHV